MYLTKLKITKFRKLENLEFDFSKDKINILIGNNGIGKTTVLDSILWLIADETLIYGKTNADNLDKNKPNDCLCVEGIFRKDDPNNTDELVLKREFKPKFTKDGEFADYSNKLYINNAEYSVKDYTARLYQEIGFNTDYVTKSFNDFMALCDFDYLGRIDYKKSREKIEKLLDISNAESIVEQEKYSPIAKDLKAVLFDTSKVTTLYNKELSNANAECAKFEALIIEQENAPKNNFRPIQEIQDEIAKLQESNFDHSEAYKNAVQEIAKARETRQEYEDKLVEKNNAFNVLDSQNTNLKKTMDAYKQKFEMEKARFITIKNSVSKCPNCGYELNGDIIKKQLTDIQKELKDIQQKAVELSNNDVFIKFKKASDDFEAFKKEYVKVDSDYNDVMAKYHDLIAEEDEKANQFDILKNQKIATLQGELNTVCKLSNTDNLVEYNRCLNEAKKKVAFVEVQKQLLEEYKQERIDFVQEQVAKVFPNIDFLLIEVSNSGAISQTCKATYKGVDYLGLNDGQKIKIGIEIIEDLRKAMQVKETLPIFINKISDLSNSNKKALRKLTNAQIFSTYPTDENEIKAQKI